MSNSKLSEKQELTLKKMKQVRKEDYVNLRKKIEAKLKFITEEKQKGKNYIELLEKKIGETNIQLIKLIGAESVLTELLQLEESNKI